MNEKHGLKNLSTYESLSVEFLNYNLRVHFRLSLLMHKLLTVDQCVYST